MLQVDKRKVDNEFANFKNIIIAFLLNISFHRSLRRNAVDDHLNGIQSITRNNPVIRHVVK